MFINVVVQLELSFRFWVIDWLIDLSAENICHYFLGQLGFTLMNIIDVVILINILLRDI